MAVKHVVTEQIPRAFVAHTLTAPDREQNVRFFRRPCAQPKNNRPLRLFHRCDKKPLVRASPKGTTNLKLLRLEYDSVPILSESAETKGNSTSHRFTVKIPDANI